MELSVLIANYNEAAFGYAHLRSQPLWNDNIETIVLKVHMGNGARAMDELVAAFTERHTEDEPTVNIFDRPLQTKALFHAYSSTEQVDYLHCYSATGIAAAWLSRGNNPRQ